MKQLIFSVPNPTLDTGVHPEVDLWRNIYHLVSPGVNIIDRCNHIVMPFNFKSIFSMPTDLSGFQKSYAEVCIDRARELIAHSKRIGKPIVILFSGGIDSTVVAISLILAAEGDHSNIKIALSTHSIRENPNFYYEHIRGKFETLPSESILQEITSNYIIVGGEGNDQLFGTDIYKAFRDYAGIGLLHENYSENNVVPFFRHSGLSEQSAKIWYSLMAEQIQATQRCEIKSVKDFFWWYNFCYKWQNVYFRIPARSILRTPLTQDILDNYYFQFFMTDDFQRWSMLNPDKKVEDTWTSYKFHAKEFIYEFTKDEEYFKYKTKIPSLINIFRKRTSANGIDENYQVVDNIDPEDYYNPNNSFVK
jgi:hypothetical protein